MQRQLGWFEKSKKDRRMAILSEPRKHLLGRRAGRYDSQPLRDHSAVFSQEGNGFLPACWTIAIKRESIEIFSSQEVVSELCTGDRAAGVCKADRTPLDRERLTVDSFAHQGDCWAEVKVDRPKQRINGTGRWFDLDSEFSGDHLLSVWENEGSPCAAINDKRKGPGGDPTFVLDLEHVHQGLRGMKSQCAGGHFQELYWKHPGASNAVGKVVKAGVDELKNQAGLLVGEFKQ